MSTMRGTKRRKLAVSGMLLMGTLAACQSASNESSSSSSSSPTTSSPSSSSPSSSGSSSSSPTSSSGPLEPMTLVNPGVALSATVGLVDGRPKVAVAGLESDPNAVSMLATLALVMRLSEDEQASLPSLAQLEEAARVGFVRLSEELSAGSGPTVAQAILADVLLVIRGAPDLLAMLPDGLLATLAGYVAVQPEATVTLLRLRSGLQLNNYPVADPTQALDDRICLAANVTSAGYTDALPLLAGPIQENRLPCVQEMMARLTPELDGFAALQPQDVGSAELGGLLVDPTTALGAVETTIESGWFYPGETIRLLARLSATTNSFSVRPPTLRLIDAMIASQARLPEVAPEDPSLEAYLFAELDRARNRVIWSVAIEPASIIADEGARSGLDYMIRVITDGEQNVGLVPTSCNDTMDRVRTLPAEQSGVYASLPFWPLQLLRDAAVDLRTCAEVLRFVLDQSDGSIAAEWATIYAGCALVSSPADSDELRRRAQAAKAGASVTWDIFTEPNNSSGQFDHYALDWLDAFASSGDCGALSIWSR